VDLFGRWGRRRYSLLQRALALLVAGVLVAVAIPYLLIGAGLALDSRLGLGGLPLGLLGCIVGFLLIVLGLSIALWSIYVQFALAEGTPIPAMPTRKLVVVPPFAYCRNPMSLGTLAAYLGIALWVGSPSGVAFMLGFSALLLIYIKLIEERELEARFGVEYVDYKRHTPFLIPRLRPAKEDRER
jgi:protein-S-isoprenylcysteine O-methyltransferase Ste14